MATVIGFPIPLLINNTFVIWITFIIFPLPCFLWIQINSVSLEFDGLDIDLNINMSSAEGYFILLLSTSFYMLLAMYLDHQQYVSTKRKPHSKAVKKEHAIIEPEGIEDERMNCVEPSDHFYIQCGSIERTFESKSGALFALKRMDLTLKKQEVLGVIGPNGAGKSTLFNLIGSYHKRCGGEIFLDGKDIEDPRNDFFDNAGLCLQEDIFWDDLSVYTHLRFICLMKDVDLSMIDKWLTAIGMEKFKTYKA